MEKTIFRGGLIVDGSGQRAYESDLLIEGDKITSIGKRVNSSGARVIDISGMVLSPGFVDIHSHSDYYLLIDPMAQSKVRQGVTTELGGNCGYSAAPIEGIVLEDRRATYKEQFGLSHDWTSVHGYFNKLQKKGISLNYAHLIGGNTIRASVMGYENRKPTDTELLKMCELINQGMDDGAFGLSLGMVYVPVCYSAREELVKLAKQLLEKKGILTTHIRSESYALVQAIEEVISIARDSGVPLQISHLKTMGEDNWVKIEKVFSLIEEAIQDGLQVTCDRYPYIAANTGLQAILPDHVLEGGREKALNRIRDAEFRKDITKEIIKLHPRENYWDQVMVSQVVSERNKDLEGKNLRAAASCRGKGVFDLFYDLLIEEDMEVDAIFFGMNQENLNKVLKKEYVMIGSDAGARSKEGPLGNGLPHPRTFGTFPRILGEYMREKGLLDLPTAINKMTGAPCVKLGIKNRGFITEGYFADITVFDPETISDSASYEDPKKYPIGIEYVLVNGQIVVDMGEHTGIRAGRVLRKGE